MSPPTRTQLCHTLKYTAPKSIESFEKPMCRGVQEVDDPEAHKDFLRVKQTIHWPTAIISHLNYVSPEMLRHPGTAHSSVVARPLGARSPLPTVIRFKTSLAAPGGRRIVVTRYRDFGTEGLIELKEPSNFLENSLRFREGTRELTIKYSGRWRQAANTIHAAMTAYGYTAPKGESIVEWMEGDVAIAGLARDALMITFSPPPIPTHSGKSAQTFIRWDFTKDGLSYDVPETRALISSSVSGS